MGKQWKWWDTLFWGGSKITADGDCSHEIQRRLLLGRKAMTNLDSILKSRDITLPTKVLLVKAMVFPVVMNRCESWTIKKAEWQRIDAFELWCWRKPLRVLWTARRFNQSILKEISPDIHWKDWCLSWNSNTLATLCEELTHWKRPWSWERLKAGREGDNRGWNVWISPTWWTWVWVGSGSWWWTGNPGMRQSMGSHRVGHNWVTELTKSIYAVSLGYVILLKFAPHPVLSGFTWSCLILLGILTIYASWNLTRYFKVLFCFLSSSVVRIWSEISS